MTLSQNIDVCIRNRELASQLLAEVLKQSEGKSERQVHEAILQALIEQPIFHDQGWYDPPPSGIGVLFADASNDFERTKYPTLRAEPMWASENYRMNPTSVGFAYISPVDKATGLISDIGFNFYQGSDVNIQNHFRNCLETAEEIAEAAEVGMPFNKLESIARTILQKRGVHNDTMVTINDPTRGSNFGHTFPWTHTEPTAEEQAAIAAGDFPKIKGFIERKRLYVNAIEDSSIPETIAFSIEPRLGSIAQAHMPNSYHYLLVTFKEGQKKVVSNLNQIFDTLSINYMRSRF